MNSGVACRVATPRTGITLRLALCLVASLSLPSCIFKNLLGITEVETRERCIDLQSPSNPPAPTVLGTLHINYEGAQPSSQCAYNADTYYSTAVQQYAGMVQWCGRYGKSPGEPPALPKQAEFCFRDDNVATSRPIITEGQMIPKSQWIVQFPVNNSEFLRVILVVDDQSNLGVWPQRIFTNGISTELTASVLRQLVLFPASRKALIRFSDAWGRQWDFWVYETLNPNIKETYVNISPYGWVNAKMVRQQ